MISLSVKYDDAKFLSDMQNLLGYAEGFLDGVQAGKAKFLENFGASTIEVLKEFIDSNARSNPEALHHVYEWYQTGSPDARLFDLSYSVRSGGLSINSTFRQSTVVKSGSNVPFYDKARIMEAGIPVTITPKKSNVLVFEDNGETVFSKGPIKIDNPGGNAVAGSYENVFNLFFRSYFSQAYLISSGLVEYIKNPIDFKKYFSTAKRGGRSRGKNVGYNWISKAGALN